MRVNSTPHACVFFPARWLQLSEATRPISWKQGSGARTVGERFPPPLRSRLPRPCGGRDGYREGFPRPLDQCHRDAPPRGECLDDASPIPLTPTTQVSEPPLRPSAPPRRASPLYGASLQTRVGQRRKGSAWRVSGGQYRRGRPSYTLMVITRTRIESIRRSKRRWRTGGGRRVPR